MTLVLALLNIFEPFAVETDASSKCIGVVLIEDGDSVAYMTHSLGPKPQALSIYE